MVESSRVALVLDDERVVLAVFRKALQNHGFVVLAAETAEAALRWSDDRQLRIDLFVADVIIPGVASGTDVVLQVRASRPDLPVLLTSGTPQDAWSAEDSRNVAALPPDSYSFLQKPFTVRTFMDSVEELLARKTPLHTA